MMQVQTLTQSPAINTVGDVLINKEETLRLYDEASKWDFSTLKRYLAQKGIYREDDIDRVCVEYCRFISLSLAHPGLPLPISEAVDKFWHAHIIFTEDYRAFGDRLAGDYIDHRPAILDDQKGLISSFKDHTLRVYTSCFGEPDTKYWNMTCCKHCTCSCRSKPALIQ